MESSKVLVRPYRKADKGGVKSVAFEGVCSNMWPAYKIALLRRNTIIIGSVLVLLCVLTFENIVNALIVATCSYFVCTFSLIWISGLIYFYISCSDLNDVELYYGNCPGSNFWVAESNGKIVGTVAIVPRETVVEINTAVSRETLPLGRTAFLRRMAVAKSRRKMGIGSKLISTAVEFCHQSAYDSVQLITTEVQDSARRLYLRNGFRNRGRKQFVYKLW